MIEQAVILCGGKGTRLGNLTKEFPKPMLPLAGRPLLDHSIELLRDAGIKRCLLAAGFFGEVIEEHYRENPIEGVEIKVVIEPKPMGTSGCLHFLADQLDDDFLIVYGDIFLAFDPSELIQRHTRTGALATLLVRQSDHPWDSDLLDEDENGKVTAVITKSGRDPKGLFKNIGNAAFYAANRRLLGFIPTEHSSDFCKDVFPACVAADEPLYTHYLEPGGYVRDMGTPDRLKVVEDYLAERAIIDEAHSNPKKIEAVFLDRDGTINAHRGLVIRPEELEMLPGAAEGIALLNQHGIRCFIVTNQPVLARGLCTESELMEIHAKLLHEIHAEGGDIEQIYYSPFHPETHHGEGVRTLRRASDCRKPGIGMITKAVREHDLDLSTCVIVGDTSNDIIAGKIAGIRTILVTNTHLEEELSPDYCVDTLLEAAGAIVSGALDPQFVDTLTASSVS